MAVVHATISVGLNAGGVMKPEMAELERLRKENTKLKMERDLLKKAAA